MEKRLRVAINAQLMPDGTTGGIETVLRALTAVAHLENGAEEYVFIGPHDDPEWLRSLLPAKQRIVRGPAPVHRVERFETFKRALGPLRPMARDLKRMVTASSLALATDVRDLPLLKIVTTVPSQNFYESLGCDVVHFPFQSFEACALPSVYNPHDLQHLHLPEFFTPAEIMRREQLHPSACHAAHTVVVASEFVKRDLVEQYRVLPAKVQVIPWAPVPLEKAHATNADDFSTLKKEFGFTEQPFALYPAMTWEHKNHIRLLEALALLRDRESITLQVVCTGHKTDFWPRIDQRIKELRLEDQVKFPGLVSRNELSALYRAAQFVFIPTLFEAASAPLFEAWQHDAAAACSSVTSLPDQAAGAALLFDPHCVEEIARALARMTTDTNLRNNLKRQGANRLQDFSLERTAKAYRAVYRHAAGRTLDEEDRGFLDRDWTHRA